MSAATTTETVAPVRQWGEGWAWPVTRLAPHFVPDRGAVGFLDPPDHTRPRRSAASAFPARGVERVRETSRRMLDELADELLQDGPPADLTAAVPTPFPIAVICEPMGVPAADRPYLAANRDSDVFPGPETIDFSRNPHPHVALGVGPHCCVGGMPAKLESELLVDALPFKKGPLVRGPETLPVTW
ncbi:hypothetical protein [Streptomyces sp. TRM70350]|uniref:hypothetical protein n=1 Tax=Streptomyces sp. TRM70350 TaxID=2856165 RepID=UPI001C444AAA|nr:hypothetical protein [Streptomyces sp. TRM70350]MBV7696455.1 hypothetical protein [Streptomyces sp. TRM70350]